MRFVIMLFVQYLATIRIYDTYIFYSTLLFNIDFTGVVMHFRSIFQKEYFFRGKDTMFCVQHFFLTPSIQADTWQDLKSFFSSMWQERKRFLYDTTRIFSTNGSCAKVITGNFANYNCIARNLLSLHNLHERSTKV